MLCPALSFDRFRAHSSAAQVLFYIIITNIIIIIIGIKFYIIVLSAVILNVHYFIIVHVLATKQAFCTGNAFVLSMLVILTR